MYKRIGWGSEGEVIQILAGHDEKAIPGQDEPSMCSAAGFLGSRGEKTFKNVVLQAHFNLRDPKNVGQNKVFAPSGRPSANPQAERAKMLLKSILLYTPQANFFVHEQFSCTRVQKGVSYGPPVVIS